MFKNFFKKNVARNVKLRRNKLWLYICFNETMTPDILFVVTCLVQQHLGMSKSAFTSSVLLSVFPLYINSWSLLWKYSIPNQQYLKYFLYVWGYIDMMNFKMYFKLLEAIKRTKKIKMSKLFMGGKLFQTKNVSTF